MNQEIFKTTALKDSAAGALLLIAIIVAFVLLGVSLLVKGQFVGPWWIYAIAAALLMVLMRIQVKNCDVVLRLVKNAKGEISVELSGKKINRNFIIGTYSYWQYTKHQGPKYGSTLYLVVTLTSKSGKSFLNLTDSRLPGREANDWPILYQELSTDEEQFMVSDIERFIEALNSARPA